MRHFVVAPIDQDVGPKWTGGSPAEQGYKVIPIPKLKRPDAKSNEYYVYANETEYKAVEAESAVFAVSISEIPVPLKVVHAHSRLADVLDSAKLQYVGKDTAYMKNRGFDGTEAGEETKVIEATIVNTEVATAPSEPVPETPAPAADPDKKE